MYAKKMCVEYVPKKIAPTHALTQKLRVLYMGILGSADMTGASYRVAKTHKMP